MTDQIVGEQDPPHVDSRRAKRPVSRRTFIGGAGLAAGVASVGAGASIHDLLTAATRSGVPDPKIPKKFPHLSFLVEREADLVLLEFIFFEFAIDKNSHPRSIRPTSDKNLIIVQFPPQAIGEAVYPSSNAGQDLLCDPAPILSRVSGRSRLSFTLPKTAQIPLPTMSPRDLLDWNGWALNVCGGAVYGGTQRAPVAPTAAQTAVEVPFGLYLSPVVDEAFSPAIARRPDKSFSGFTTEFESAVDPLVVNHVTACWSTSLTNSPVHEAGPVTPQVAAVWSRDYASADVTPQDEIQY
jgi:hypothetical protein